MYVVIGLDLIKKHWLDDTNNVIYLFICILFLKQLNQLDQMIVFYNYILNLDHILNGY